MARVRQQMELPYDASASARRKGRRAKKGRPLGRKPRAERKGFVVHATRPLHDELHPVHVTMRRVRLGPSFRSQLVYETILAEIRAAKHRGVRIVEYSIQDNHLHLMIEGQDRADLAKQMCGLFSRIAMAVNRVARRHGPLFRDRHHRHELSNPTKVRNALVYILFNLRKHASGDDNVDVLFDAFSSAPWFEGWAPEARPPPELLARTRPHSPCDTTSRPRTWLANIGWTRGRDAHGKRRGPLRFDEQPVRPT